MYEQTGLEVLGWETATHLLSRVKFHYSPKHASWLNMAEIEIGILEYFLTSFTHPEGAPVEMLRQNCHIKLTCLTVSQYNHVRKFS